MEKKMRIMVLGITGLFLGLIQIGLAQEEEKAFDLSEIVVTATKTEKAVEDISATVSVITREEIEASNATSVMDILGTLPGVFVKKQEPFGRADINIRGYGDKGRRIMVLIDGRPVKVATFGCTVTHSLPLDNVERIEVVRGPASVLYGTDALGGVINIITREVKEGYETDFTTSGGSYNTQQYLFRHGGKVDRFHYYITADNKHSDGHRDNSKYDGKDYTAKVGLDLNENMKVTLLSKYFHGRKREPGPESEPTPDAWSDYERSANDLALTCDWDYSDASFKLYQNYGHHEFSDGFHMKDYTTGFMLKYSTRYFADNELTLGFDWRDMKGKLLDVPPGPPWDMSPSPKKEYAFYFLNEHTFLDRFILSLGARSNYDSKYGEHFCPHLGMVYHLDEDTVLRTAANKGFRSPSISDLYMTPAANEELKPEEVWNYEIGFDRRITENFTGDIVFYWMEGKNLIERKRNPSPPPMYLLKNTGKFKFKGVELGLDWRMVEGWHALFNYTYLDSGDNTAGRPEDKFDLTVTYKREKLLASLTCQYVQDLYNDDEKENPLSDYFVANGKITYEFNPNFKAFLAVDNIFDQDYEIEKDYPMPGQTFTLGMTAKF